MRRHLANPDLPSDARRQMLERLNSLLASVLDLSMQAKHAHWNVRGTEFWSAHELFDDIAQRLRHHADVIAERAAALGGAAQGTARQVGENSRIEEYDLNAVTPQQHLQALAQRMSSHGKELKQAAEEAGRLGDVATEDVFIEQLRELDLDTWFLDASLPVEADAERERVSQEQQPAAPPLH